MSETIAAVITPAGTGAIAVLRLSGSNAINIANLLTKKTSFKNRVASFSKIYDGNTVVDTGLVTCFYAPNSYTGEDVVEISVHGGSIISENVLSLLLKYGSRLANPGEFTKRAYLNGKMGLLEAEAVADVINAETLRTQNHATKILSGTLSTEFVSLRNDLLECLSLLEISIDFLEENNPVYQTNDFVNKIDSLLSRVGNALNGFCQSRLSQYGATVAIAGEPNAGKSSLFNYLVRKNRSIVTEIAGTTRDYVSEKISLRGYPVTLVDTAGIREDGAGVVEKLGMKKTQEILNIADLVLYLVPPESQPPEKLTPNQLLAYSKSDLSLNNISGNLSFSSLSGEGIPSLLDKIVTTLFGEAQDGSVHKERHKNVLELFHQNLLTAKNSTESESPIELIAEDLRVANHTLGLLFGEHLPNKVLNNIFSNFCIGK